MVKIKKTASEEMDGFAAQDGDGREWLEVKGNLADISD